MRTGEGAMTGMVGKTRELRKAMTAAEQRAWWLLRDRNLLGLKFRRQHSIGKFVVDFYCSQSRLAVELDGSVHGQPSQTRKDSAKDAYLKRLGIRVLRLPNGMVLEDPELFRRKVYEAATENYFKINECALATRPPSPVPTSSGHPLPEGEGRSQVV